MEYLITGIVCAVMLFLCVFAFSLTNYIRGQHHETRQSFIAKIPDPSWYFLAGHAENIQKTEKTPDLTTLLNQVKALQQSGK